MRCFTLFTISLGFCRHSLAIELNTAKDILDQRNKIAKNQDPFINYYYLQNEPMGLNSLQGQREGPLNDIQELYIEQRLNHFEAMPHSSSSEYSDGNQITSLQQRYFYSERYISPTIREPASGKDSPNVRGSADSDRIERRKKEKSSTTFAFLCVGGEGPSLTKHVLLDSVHCTGDMLELAEQLYEVSLLRS